MDYCLMPDPSLPHLPSLSLSPSLSPSLSLPLSLHSLQHLTTATLFLGRIPFVQFSYSGL